MTDMFRKESPFYPALTTRKKDSTKVFFLDKHHDNTMILWTCSMIVTWYHINAMVQEYMVAIEHHGTTNET